MAPVKGVLLAHTNFPLYTVQSLDERHFLVAGGGGQAKTGVANAVEIHEVKASKQGVQSVAVCRHETGTHAVMNCASFYDGRHHHLATGEDELCRSYSVKYKVVTPTKAEKADTDKANGTATRQRKGEKATDDGTANGSAQKQKQLTFQIEGTGEVATDFSSDGGFQKCVRFFPDFSQLVTGGGDGHVRVWKYPDFKKVLDIHAHKNEIDDLDVSPDGSKIITVSRDTNGSVWNAKDGKKITDLVWNQKTDGAYRFRACRYGLIEGKKDKYNIYSVNIPVTRSAKNQCFISLWDCGKFSIKKTAKTGSEVISSFTVSKEGVYLGVGTISGSVAVYISFSLQKLYMVKEAHSIFVTGVEFMPSSEAARAVTGDQDFNLLSISADNTVRLHQCPERTFINPVWPILALIAIIYFLFSMMADMGL
ncbi:prolactin regulatory element-binding protein [Aplysia californica]|uniref:Prolactin regulatory element-binding protein n=1 Tax=Aplysia californica TaxID=6500 RepID=A0ABM0JP93_APLCA|nr:prolactin regulatory element-binding protein [Aplysia californica]